MNAPAVETYPLRVQAPVYGAALFTGNLFPMISVIMPLWALELGATPLILGVIISSRQILTVTLSIHSGALMDRFGPRQVILVCGLAGAVTMGLYPLLPFIWAAIALQTISGFTETTNWIGTQAMVGRMLKGHAVYAGRMTAAARIGGFFGPWLVGLAWQFIGASGAFMFLAFWVACGVAAAWFVPKESPGDDAPAEDAPPRKSRAADVLPRMSDYTAAFRMLLIPAVVLIIAATLSRQAGSGMQSSFYTVWLKEIGFTGGNIGLLIGISNAASAVAALNVGRVNRYVADRWLLLIMVAFAIVGVSITPLLGDVFWLLAAAIALRGIGQGINLPMMIAIGARAVGVNLQGRVIALRISFNRVGSALVPIVMGGLAEIIGLEYTFYAMGLTGLAMVFLLSLWVARRPDLAGGDAGRE